MNYGRLRKYIEGRSDDEPCCFTIWDGADVEAQINEHLPEDSPMTDDEIAQTLGSMYIHRDASIGTTWETINEEIPQSVKDRLE